MAFFAIAFDVCMNVVLHPANWAINDFGGRHDVNLVKFREAN
jgi:hypothetical protein